MVKEKSVGVAVFRGHGSHRVFLLLHYNAGHWGFPKGHIEPGETEVQALLREIREETGLTGAETVPGFRQHTSYFFKRGNETVFKEVVFFLAKAGKGSVRLSFEHQGFEWLPFKEALQRLTFKNTRQVLEKANDFLGGKAQNITP